MIMIVDNYKNKSFLEMFLPNIFYGVTLGKNLDHKSNNLPLFLENEIENIYLLFYNRYL